MSATDSREFRFDDEDIQLIREVLLIGLACYGEIEQKVSASELAESIGRPWPAEMRPIHPTGTTDVTSKFATALTIIG